MWALCAFVTAQEAAVEMTVSSTSVTQGDMLRLTLTFVNCKVKEIEPPQIKGLEWRMGPSNVFWQSTLKSQKTMREVEMSNLRQGSQNKAEKLN